MNAREKFHAIMNFDTSVQTLKWEFGYWADTLLRWWHPSRAKGRRGGFRRGEPLERGGRTFRNGCERLFRDGPGI
jgi:hypothetical protein